MANAECRIMNAEWMKRHSTYHSAFSILHSSIMYWFDVHERAAFAASAEFGDALLAERNHTIYIRVNGPILADVRVVPRTVPVALLPNEHLAGGHALASEALHTSSLGLTVPHVAG